MCVGVCPSQHIQPNRCVFVCCRVVIVLEIPIALAFVILKVSFFYLDAKSCVVVDVDCVVVVDVVVGVVGVVVVVL